MTSPQPKPRPKPTPAKARQLRDTTQNVVKTAKVSKSTQPCPKPVPPKDWGCNKYGTRTGPYYKNKKNKQPMKDYGRWQSMINSGKITETDAKLMLLMSPNEGDFNSVQAYDDQAITAGAMQKTINTTGEGELSQQLGDFKKANPGKFKTLFSDQGWDVDGGDTTDKNGKTVKKRYLAKYSYTDKDGKLVTVKGNELYDFFKSYCNAKTSKEKKAQIEKALDSMRQGVEDEDYKDLQVLDFKKRVEEAVGQKPVGYDYPISDYATTAKSQALVLDQSVNRPAYVDDDYGKALDDFYKKNPKAPKNPADWGDKRGKYEDEINESYGNNRRGTDMANRYKAIKNAADPSIPADTVPKPTNVPVTTPPPVVTPPSSGWSFPWPKF